MIKHERKPPAVRTVPKAKTRPVPGHVSDEHEPRQSLGQWLIANMRRVGKIETPPRHEDRERPAPFADWTEEEWEAFDRKHGTR